jgi:hypothetical protein
MGERRIWVLAHLAATADVKIDTTPRLNRLCWPKSAEHVTKPTGIGTACSFLDLSWLRGNRLLEGGIRKPSTRLQSPIFDVFVLQLLL